MERAILTLEKDHAKQEEKHESLSLAMYKRTNATNKAIDTFGGYLKGLAAAVVVITLMDAVRGRGEMEAILEKLDAFSQSVPVFYQQDSPQIKKPLLPVFAMHQEPVRTPCPTPRKSVAIITDMRRYYDWFTHWGVVVT